jgi:hypothetical protein
MLIKNKRSFIKGLLLAITFVVILVIMFSPIFNGENALRAADRLFNSIAKGSTYYIDDLIKKNAKFKGTDFNVNLKFENEKLAENVAKVLTASGAKVNRNAAQLTANGDLGGIIEAALSDSDSMFKNDNAALQQKYGLAGKEALFVWWKALNEADKDLSRQKNFKQAAWVSTVIKKAVEVGYNFFNISSQSASSKAGRLTFSMIFYVIYTLWWGIAIFYLFDGFGLEMKAKGKKEV